MPDEVSEDDPACRDFGVLLRHLEVREAGHEERGQPIGRDAHATGCLDLERGTLGRGELPVCLDGHRGCLLGASLPATRGG
jgi:hypothetical protein